MQHALRTTIDIDAPASVVWDVLTDLDAYADWNPFIVSASGMVATGERLVNRVEPPGGRGMTFKPTVTEVEDGRTFEWLRTAQVAQDRSFSFRVPYAARGEAATVTIVAAGRVVSTTPVAIPEAAVLEGGEVEVGR